MRPQQHTNYTLVGFFTAKRSVARTFVRMPAWVSVDSDSRTEHIGFVRDISTKGLFFYSDFKPVAGDSIKFVLVYLKGANRVRLHLSGKVVRLEYAAGAAVGVAVLFDSPQENVPRSLVRTA